MPRSPENKPMNAEQIVDYERRFSEIRNSSQFENATKKIQDEFGLTISLSYSAFAQNPHEIKIIIIDESIKAIEERLSDTKRVIIPFDEFSQLADENKLAAYLTSLADQKIAETPSQSAQDFMNFLNKK